MTDYAEHLEKELLAARSELAELRMRVCVPDVATREMKDAALAELERQGFDCQDFVVQPVYQAMLAAAPAPVERLATDGGRNQRFEGLFEGETPDQRDARLASAAPVERVKQEAVSYYERAHGKKSPTHGMSLDERIEHVSGRTNTAGYIEFDNVMAVSALIDHVLRDSPAPRPAAPAAPANCSEDAINSAIQVAFELGGLEDGSYHLEDDQLTEVLACAVYHSAPTAAQDVSGPTMLELLEKIDTVRMGDEESKHHGRGAVYWNNAVVACLDAVRKAHQSGGAK